MRAGLDDEEEYDEIIKESLKELEQNSVEEQMFQDMLKETIVQSKKEFDDIERKKQIDEINKVKDDPKLLHEKQKEIINKASNILISDNIHKPGKLPPLQVAKRDENEEPDYPYKYEVRFHYLRAFE